MRILIFTVLWSILSGNAKAQAPKNVAIFIHEGVELLDFAGPGEAFASAKNSQGALFNVYTVAPSTEAIRSQGFVRITPTYSLDNCPKPDILVLPGGLTGIPMKDEKLIAWIRKTAPTVECLLTVCTGVFLAAKADLLNGRTVTTHFCCRDDLAAQFPAIKVVEGVRFVDNGRIVTTEGVSAGIDGALHVIGKLYGRPVAQKTADYMMYHWEPDLPTKSKPVNPVKRLRSE